MTNDQTAMLARYGIDYAEAMERFCGNESLFARIAVKYLDDPHVDALEAAMASGDAAAAEREAHSLKGVAGNLSFVRLYDLAARVTDALRANDIDSARALMPDLRESHRGAYAFAFSRPNSSFQSLAANTVPAKMTTQQTIDIGVGIVPCNTSANRTAQAE